MAASSIRRARRGRRPGAERLLIALEQRLVAIQAQLHAVPPPGRRLTFTPVAAAQAPRTRLRFRPVPAPSERLVFLNLDVEPGYVAFGDFELEVAPGETATLWRSADAPDPTVRRGFEPVLDRLFFSDAVAPLILAP